jgi:hypothetical protein
MKGFASITRVTLIATIVGASIVGFGGPWSRLAGGQAPPPASPRKPATVDTRPIEQAPEVQALLKGTFRPDPGEPAGAIRAHVETEDKLRKAMRRIEIGLEPGEADFDPGQLLDEALVVRRESTDLYPKSRHAWEGVGDALWQKYLWAHRGVDLREGVDAYVKATELMIPRGAAGDVGRDFISVSTRIAKGLAALSDGRGLDQFFGKLRGTEFWDLSRGIHAMALGALNDPRAEQLFQDMLKSGPADAVLPTYVDYLMDQKRYREALEAFDKIRGRLYPANHVQRGAILEHLGRHSEAQAEYRKYFDKVADQRPWGPAPLPDRYRVPGSGLQSGMKFRPVVDRLPKPLGRLAPWLGPAPAFADHGGLGGCPVDDIGCRTIWYLKRTIHGEVGCVNADPGCVGTVGGQRAVAWNIRTRTFFGRGTRTCFGRTETCFNYAGHQTFDFGDLTTLAHRYYQVIETGTYLGLTRDFPNTTAELEAESVFWDVIVNASVPDPIAGDCIGGGMVGDPCEGSCLNPAGIWGMSFAASDSGIEFRGGRLERQTGPSTSCWWQELVPSGSPGGSRCGTQCFAPVQLAAICPKYGTLQRAASCVGSTLDWGPKWGNFYWRFFDRSFRDPATRTNRDFNSDNRGDILWRQPSSGTVAVWLLDGDSVIDSGVVATVGSDWQVAGVGDFDGDSRNDILWRHVSGSLSVWRMNGLGVITTGAIGSVGSDWQVTGVSDVNGDGRADVLWRHASGTVAVWLMNGFSIAGTGVLGSVAPSWVFAGSGDFNGDGKADLVWRNVGTGEASAWLMNGASVTEIESLGSGPLDWTIAGVSDVDLDGQADIVWRNTTSGEVTVWLMYGTSLMTSAAVGSAGLDWAIAGLRDLNGDGRADILWRHTSGAVAVWLLDGASIIDSGSPGSAGPDWQIQ